jgi:tripartite-type tricarboxylate transporter receptor subunit TctC
MTAADTPDEIVAKMEEAIKAAFDDPAVQDAYKSMGFNSYWLSGADLTEELNGQMPAVAQAYQDLKKDK